jgi:hypothetical protein
MFGQAHERWHIATERVEGAATRTANKKLSAARAVVQRLSRQFLKKAKEIGCVVGGAVWIAGDNRVNRSSVQPCRGFEHIFIFDVSIPELARQTVQDPDRVRQNTVACRICQSLVDRSIGVQVRGPNFSTRCGLKSFNKFAELYPLTGRRSFRRQFDHEIFERAADLQKFELSEYVEARYLNAAAWVNLDVTLELQALQGFAYRRSPATDFFGQTLLRDHRASFQDTCHDHLFDAPIRFLRQRDLRASFVGHC